MRSRRFRSRIHRSVAATAACACLGLVVGCGSSGSDESAAPQLPKLTAEQRAPRGASEVEREIYRQFPRPKPETGMPRSAKVIKAGERACRGKTPVEVKNEFWAKASSRLVPGQKEMISEIGRYAKQAKQDQGFTAGQLAADVYQATLPVAVNRFGYQGCVYALALGLKRELAHERKAGK